MTDRRTDGRTEGHPESIGPQPLGLGPKNDLNLNLNNHVSMTFRSKVLARTSSSLENRYFGLFWPI